MARAKFLQRLLTSSPKFGSTEVSVVFAVGASGAQAPGSDGAALPPPPPHGTPGAGGFAALVRLGGPCVLVPVVVVRGVAPASVVPAVGLVLAAAVPVPVLVVHPIQLALGAPGAWAPAGLLPRGLSPRWAVSQSAEGRLTIPDAIALPGEGVPPSPAVGVPLFTGGTARRKAPCRTAALRLISADQRPAGGARRAASPSWRGFLSLVSVSAPLFLQKSAPGSSWLRPVFIKLCELYKASGSHPRRP